jgi:hypothetical protein
VDHKDFACLFTSAQVLTGIAIGMKAMGICELARERHKFLPLTDQTEDYL